MAESRNLSFRAEPARLIFQGSPAVYALGMHRLRANLIFQSCVCRACLWSMRRGRQKPHAQHWRQRGRWMGAQPLTEMRCFLGRRPSSIPSSSRYGTGAMPASAFFQPFSRISACRHFLNQGARKETLLLMWLACREKLGYLPSLLSCQAMARFHSGACKKKWTSGMNLRFKKRGN